MGYFPVRSDSRVKIYERKMFIRLAAAYSLAHFLNHKSIIDSDIKHTLFLFNIHCITDDDGLSPLYGLRFNETIWPWSFQVGTTYVVVLSIRLFHSLKATTDTFLGILQKRFLDLFHYLLLLGKVTPEAFLKGSLQKRLLEAFHYLLPLKLLQKGT